MKNPGRITIGGLKGEVKEGKANITEMTRMRRGSLIRGSLTEVALPRGSDELAEKNSNTHLTLQEEVTTNLLSNKFEEEVVKIVVKID